MTDQELGVASAQERRPQPGQGVSHTPGPWVVVCTNQRASNPHMGWWDVETPTGYVVAASLSLADATAVAAMPELLNHAKRFAACIEYEIRVSLSKGDDEGANLKGFVLGDVLATIAKATEAAQ